MSVCFQILQLQMNDYKYHYLFTTFVSTLGPRKWMERGSTRPENAIRLSVFQDIETFDLEDFKYNFVNITAFRLVDAEDVGVRSILRDMERYQPSGNTILNKSRVIQVGKKFPCHRESLHPSREIWRSSVMFARSVIPLLPIYSRAIDFSSGPVCTLKRMRQVNSRDCSHWT